MEIVMPKVGLTMTEGSIAQWHKTEGDFVQQGELLFTFETEKSSLEYESPASGVLSRILVHAGDTVACYTPVAVMGDAPAEKPLISPATVPAEAAPISMGSTVTIAPSATKQPASPRAKLRARELGVDLSAITGSGPEQAVRERDVLAFAAQNEPAATVVVASNVTPVAKRMAAELGVDLASITGTGPDGRITREDVVRAAEAKPAPVAAPSTAAAPGEALTPIRRVTAQRMAANAQQAPHVTLHTEVDATELVSARNQLNAELRDKISYNALLVAICAKALKEHPALNASWQADGGAVSISKHTAAHIGVAVDTQRGLLVPVLRDCERKPLAQIHAELNELVSRTVAGKAKPEELGGGTFTITNLGMFEVDGFTPIINLPEAAILGVGRIVKKAVVGDDDKIVVRQMMTLSLSFDHRVVDGAPAAKFLQRVKQLIERPFALMV